jgi:endoglucanase
MAVAAGVSLAVFLAVGSPTAVGAGDSSSRVGRPATGSVSAGTRLTVRVLNGRLVGRYGHPVRLLGVNRSGTQYACVEGWGIFDGPTDATSLQAIRAWHANAVRVSLNEDCWLGINGVKKAYSGYNYRSAIRQFVGRLNTAGLRVILDLHWNAPGTHLATDQQPMPDADHAPAFWKSVATWFKGNRSVVFDLYNEPYPDSNRDTTAAWTCIRYGGTCRGVPFKAAGSQTLLNAVRGTGALNVVMVGGPEYAGQLDHWRAYRPSDPLNQLAASIHIYYLTPDSPDWSPCYLESCWTHTIVPVAAKFPVVIGELGEHDCSSHLIDGTALSPPQDSLLDWADAHNVSYLAWSWFTGDCADEPALISDYDGTPTAYGRGIRDHLIGLG